MYEGGMVGVSGIPGFGFLFRDNSGKSGIREKSSGIFPGFRTLPGSGIRLFCSGKIPGFRDLESSRDPGFVISVPRSGICHYFLCIQDLKILGRGRKSWRMKTVFNRPSFTFTFITSHITYLCMMMYGGEASA